MFIRTIDRLFFVTSIVNCFYLQTVDELETQLQEETEAKEKASYWTYIDINKSVYWPFTYIV